MKVLAVLGSPKAKNSSTELILDEYLKGLKENNNDVKKVKLGEKNISGCKGCNYCGFGERYCINEDDMQGIYPLIEAADYIVFATPIYWFSMTSQIKACIDRLYALGMKVWEGKKIGVISTYGGEDNVSSGYNIIESNFKAICDFSGIPLAFSCGIPAEDLLNEELKKEHLKKVYECGKSI